MTGHPQELLSALLDGELDATQRRDVETHLAGCPSCARHLEELKAVDVLARGLPPVAVPDGYLDALPGRVRARIRADRSPSAARAPWVWPLAAGLALAVLAPLVLREGPSPTPTPVPALQEKPAQSADAIAPQAEGLTPPAAPPDHEDSTSANAVRRCAAPEAKARQEKPAQAADAIAPQAEVLSQPAAPPDHEYSTTSNAVRRGAAPEAKARQDAPRRQATGGLAGEPSAKVVSPRERAETVTEERA